VRINLQKPRGDSGYTNWPFPSPAASASRSASAQEGSDMSGE
jgi:hypothetical protein